MTKCSECVKREQCKRESIDVDDAVLETVGCTKGFNAEELIELNKKLEILNKLEVVGHDSDGDGIIYVHVWDDEESRKILEDLGATEEDFETMTSEMEGSDCLDITEFAFYKLNAGCWSTADGFKAFSEEV